MKKIILILILLLIPSQGYAWKDICKYGEKMLYQTSFELQEFFEDKIKDSRFSVRGTVRNVSPKSIATSLYDVKVDCGNDIIVVVATSSPKVEKLKVGDRAGFTCDFYKYRRRFYRASDNIYVKLWCFD